jgi:hypothetical protein
LTFEDMIELGSPPPNRFRACVIGEPAEDGTICPGDPSQFHRIRLNWDEPNAGTPVSYDVWRVTGASAVCGSANTKITTVFAPTLTAVDNEELPNGGQFTYCATANLNNHPPTGSSNPATIGARNNAPLALGESLFTYENTSASGNVLSNDTDDDTKINATTFAPLRAVLVTAPSTGTLTSHGVPLTPGAAFDGSFSFVPATDFEGTGITFTYKANDGFWTDGTTPMSPDSAPQTVTITNVFSRHTTTSIVSSSNPSSYGNAVTFTATVTADSTNFAAAFGKPAGTVTIKEGATVLATGTPDVNGQVTFVSSSLTASGTGDHIITALYCAGDAHLLCSDTIYYGSQATVTEHVNPRTATVSAVAASKTYGNSDPALTTTNDNFVPTDLGLAKITFSATRAPGETVAGSPYAITPAANDHGTGLLANYNVTFNTATFTITRRDATWTTTANSKTYGDPDPVPSTTGSGNNFVAADGVTATYSRAAGETVGVYHITATLGPEAVLSNYNIANSGADFTIIRRDATWTTSANSKTYGDPDPIPLTTGRGSNFVASDFVTATYTRVPGEFVAGNPYHITATLGPEAVLGNYNITNAGATFTINARPATWTTNSNSKTYGNADPNPLTTGSGSNFIESDAVTATYKRAEGETVAGGPYHITATLGPEAALSNYIIANAGANFAINARPATWTTNPSSKIFGDADPNPLTTGSGSNFLEGDAVTATYSRAAGGTVDGGPYHITATLSPVGVLGNYTITNNGADFTINRATPVLSVAFSPSTVPYDGNGHPAAASIGGVNGTTLDNPVDGLVTISYKKAGAPFGGTPTDAASYTASAHFASTNGNYTDADTTSDASLTIAKASAHISVAPYNVTYDGNAAHRRGRLSERRMDVRRQHELQRNEWNRSRRDYEGGRHRDRGQRRRHVWRQRTVAVRVCGHRRIQE